MSRQLEPSSLPASDVGTGPVPGVLPGVDPSIFAALERSIVARGCLVPILIASDGTIIDGVMREAIGKKHGIFIPRVVIGDLNAQDKIDLRLILNAYRRHLSRQEWREIIAYELRKAPGRSDRLIGSSVGVSHVTVGRVRETLEDNGQIDHCPTRMTSDNRQFPSQRKPMVFAETEKAAKKAAEILEHVGADLPAKPHTFRKLKSTAHAMRQSRERSASKPVTLGDGIEVIARDFRALGDEVQEESASLLMLDPPWGAEGESENIRRELAEVAYRLALPGKFAAIYTGVAGIDDFSVHFRAAGWVYRWMVSCERKNATVSGRIFRRWVPIVIYQKPPGAFTFPGFLSDRIPAGEVEKLIHPWAQPAPESKLMVEALTSAGELVVDLTCGSCSSAIGMIEAAGGTRRYFGCDTNSEMIEAARSRIAARLEKQGGSPG